MKHMLAGVCLAMIACVARASAEAPAAAGTPATAAARARPQMPKVIGMGRIEFPQPADREALVILCLTISAEGEATDVTLLEGGFHEQRFVDAAIRGARRTKFRPAMLNGVPIAYQVRWPIRFGLGEKGSEPRGIKPDFRRELKKVDALIKAGDYAGGHFHAQWMLAEKVKLGYEYAVLQAELAYTHAGVGNIHRAIEAARAASEPTSPRTQDFALRQPVPKNTPSNYLLPRDVVVSLMDTRMMLAASQGMYLDALKVYYDMAGLAPIPESDRRAVLAENLTKALEGSDPLVAKVSIGESRSWTHELFRNRFTVARVQGEIGAMHLDCGAKAQKLEYRPDFEWAIPASWGDCELDVTADAGTSFEIVEFADAPPAQPAG